MSRPVVFKFRLYVAGDGPNSALAKSNLERIVAAAPEFRYTLEVIDFLADPLREHFGCLLVDIQLGGMTGVEMHRKLIEQGNRTPVVYITAFDDPRVREEAERLGCAGYFRKSDAGTDILAAVRRVAKASGAA